MQWSASLPHSKRVVGLSPLVSCGLSAWSWHVLSMCALRVIHVRLIPDFKLAVGVWLSVLL